MNIKKLYFLVFLLFPLLFSCTKENLKVDAVFSDHMVLQRNHKIPVWGTVKPNTKIQAVFNGETLTTTSNGNGIWKVYFEAQKAGGPFQLEVSSGNQTIKFKDILVGEVWLASGQSNMHLDLKRTLNGEEVAQKANNANIRIYNMRPTYPTGKEGVHTLKELDKIQNNNYFNTKGWVKVTPENVLYFSAVAYYFAEKLQGKLNIPIGIIHNAVPGSPIESWLSKKVIEEDSEITNFVKERWADKDNEKDAMITVAKNQISLSKNEKQKHPWMPSYNYENGILPLKNVPFKGVIWYQGESNAERPKLYQKMFQKMVTLWRSDFNSNFPFYYTQLTSREDRAAWSEFRNAQRESLNEVPNTKMIVITDVGDKQDTHAKNKQPVGERLALLALGDTYHTVTDYESPMFDTITFSQNTYFLNFKGEFSSLKTKESRKIVGFEISYDNINFQKFEPIIQGKLLKFTMSEKHQKPIYIRYAWKPYTEANLISNKGLPVSTFRIKIE
ncbi:sialate O-acetylesterase [Polaribacter sp. MSW13]|uniref:Sialate O-acetylesterase n=1 Tax=Polaribacter marinus TaxID=2916838 RepID=A0A9X2AK96_9FLAO|nr:sialate O-acetylesterase [Polaribacter marinus]MCI2229842.1 sialate O-acetylesterase [Polaribacter marinus]